MKKCLALMAIFSLALNSWAFAGSVTHQGADPADHVMLESVSSYATLTQAHFRRINSSGLKGRTDFEVPPGKALVITDVDFLYTHGLSQDNNTLMLRVNSKPVTLIPFQLDGTGICVKSHMMNAGVIVGSGAKISAQAVAVGAGQLDRVILRGYLVDTSVVQ